MPRRRAASGPAVVHRTARVEVRVSSGQRERCFGLLRSAGDVWAVLLQANRWRRERGAPGLVGYQELCRELAAAGPGVFGELSTVGARSVLRRYSDAWFAAAARANAGAARPGFPRRRRGLVPVRFYAGTFTLDGRRLRLPVAAGCAPLWLRLTRPVPYPPDTVRSVTLLHQGGRLFVEVTAELPVAVYPAGQEPDRQRVAGVDLGIIHPYAVATGAAATGADPDGGAAGLLVSGRALRAEHRLHLSDTKRRSRAVAARAPARGQRGSRRWKKTRARARTVEGRHARRISQAQHEAADAVVAWAVQHRIGTLVVGDPRSLLQHDAGRRHNRAVRTWQVGGLIAKLTDKATLAGLQVHLVDERGTSSTCPACTSRVPKPRGRQFRCGQCGHHGHRDLVGAANIAGRTPGGNQRPPDLTGAPPTHRRAGRHLPGAGPSRRDPRRTHLHTGRGSRGRPGPPWPAPPLGESLASTTDEDQTTPAHRANVA
ncbi:MAG: transposase [Frankiaceae bacterium]|nr:transposase [Frankiaceae bacterium]